MQKACLSGCAKYVPSPQAASLTAHTGLPERSSSGSTALPEGASPAAGQGGGVLPQQLAEGQVGQISKDLPPLSGALPVFETALSFSFPRMGQWEA